TLPSVADAKGSATGNCRVVSCWLHTLLLRWRQTESGTPPALAQGKSGTRKAEDLQLFSTIKRSLRLSVFFVVLLWAGTALAQQIVHFPSLEDNGPGRPPTVLDGYLFRPVGEGRHPAIVALHG